MKQLEKIKKYFRENTKEAKKRLFDEGIKKDTEGMTIPEMESYFEKKTAYYDGSIEAIQKVLQFINLFFIAMILFNVFISFREGNYTAVSWEIVTIFWVFMFMNSVRHSDDSSKVWEKMNKDWKNLFDLVLKSLDDSQKEIQQLRKENLILKSKTKLPN